MLYRLCERPRDCFSLAQLGQFQIAVLRKPQVMEWPMVVVVRCAALLMLGLVAR
jgi:hypothetical protein